MDTQFLISLLLDPFADEPNVAPKPVNVDECLCGQPIPDYGGFEMCEECNDRITSKYGFDPQP